MKRSGILRWTEVKNLGDGLMVVFTSAADAVASSITMQRAFEHRNRRADRLLTIRIGIALGDADVEEVDYFGAPVVQAARLCAAADGGTILCTDVVRMLAGTRGDASFEPMGEIELKGLEEPVAASWVTWQRTDLTEQQAPLPVRLAAAHNPTFVGRDDEHERLTTAWKVATVARTQAKR